MQTIRRIFQVLFVLLFFLLFFLATYPYNPFIPSEIFLRLSPLIFLTVSIASRTIVKAGLISIVVFVTSIVMGRLFCGWICPMGSTLDAVDASIKKNRLNKEKANHVLKRWHKYWILIALLTASVFSFQLAGFFDPISILTRTTVTVFYPLFVFVINTMFDLFFALPFFEDMAFELHAFLQGKLLPVQSVTFIGSMLFALIFLGILLLSKFQKRSWCRSLCPLGALLGLLSRFRVYRRQVSEACTSCSICYSKCRMGAIQADYKGTDQSECINCMDCETDCPENAIRFGFYKNIQNSKIDLDRRRILGAGLTGFATVGLMQIGYKNKVERDKVVRPPAALEETDFLDHCIRCGECVRICSTSGAGLQLIGLKSGWQGLATPALVTPTGYCEYNCILCGEVCPTGAIPSINIEEKHEVKMGTAHFDKTVCIPWYYGENCMVCEEHCPTSEKAIQFSEQLVRTIDGKEANIFLPYVDEQKCVGCGICTKVCPVAGDKGIFLTRDGEVRS